MNRSRLLASLALVLLAACPGGEGKPDPTPAATFTVDPYPAFVSAWPVVLSGTKPAGTGVWVDGVREVAPSDTVVWSLALPLTRGDQSYAFLLQQGDAAVPEGEGITVEVTLDTVAPAVTGRVPAADAMGVPLNSMIEAQLDEPLDCATAVAGSFVLMQGATPVGCTLRCANAGGGAVVTLEPASDLAASKRHTATLFAEVTDRAGNSLADAVTWQFETGTETDTTPPPPPTVDDPPPPQGATTLARVALGGAKEAFASVELQWTAGAELRRSWTEIAPKSGDTRWQHTFDLEEGGNTIALRSVDAAGNSSSVVEISITRDAASGTVASPTLAPVVTPTKVGTQVVTGTKPAGTSIWTGAVQLAPLDDAATWSALVTLAPGENHLEIIAKDPADNASPPAPRQTILFDDTWGRVSGGSLEIELTIADLWDHIGDEFTAGPAGNDIDHFSVEAWVEGPLTFAGAADSYTVEPCRFDATRHERRHTRYLATVVRSAYSHCLESSSPGQCYGFWWEPDYRSPNYLAALIEAGQWESSTYPIPRDVDRRNTLGLMWQGGVAPGCDSHLWFDTGSGSCKPRMMQAPAIDGVTEATINADFPANGLALGAWSSTRRYTWDLTDRDGQPVPKGPYLVTLVVTVDRDNQKSWAADQETCWDRPEHDVKGSHRIEGIVMLDGATAYDADWIEKGLPESAAACTEPTAGNLVTCECGGNTAFPCPAVPNTAVGEPVRYLLGPARVTYVP